MTRVLSLRRRPALTPGEGAGKFQPRGTLTGGEMAALREILNREYRANVAGFACLFFGIAGLYLNLDYLMFAAAAGCLICNWWRSGSTLVWVLGETIEAIIAVVILGSVMLGLQYLGIRNYGLSYRQLIEPYWITAAFLMWKLASHMLSSMGWLDRYTVTILGDSQWAADERRRIEKQFRLSQEG